MKELSSLEHSLFPCPRLRFSSGVKPNSRIGGDGLFGLRIALAQNLVQDDSREGRRTDATKRETADVDGEVASTHREGNCRRHEVTALGEVHVILYPNAPAGGGNQAKEHDGKPAEHA